MKQAKIHYAWIVLVGCCLFTFTMQGMVLGTFGSYTTCVADDFGVGQSKLSLALTCEMLGMAIAMPIMGSLMRKAKLSLLAAGSVIVIAGGLLAVSMAHSMGLLYLAWTLIGASVSVTLLLPVLVGNWFADKLGLATGIVAAIASVGAAIFNPLVSSLITHIGWRASYRAMAIVILIVLVPVAFLLRYAPQEGQQPYGADRIQKNDLATPAAGANDGLTFRQALHSPLFYLILLASALFSSFSSVFQQVIPHLISQGFQPTLAATVLSCMSIGSAVGKVAIGPFLDSKRRNQAIVAVAIFAAVGWAGIALTPGESLTFVCAIIGGLGQCCGLVAIPYLSRRYFGGKEMLKISGLSGALCTLVPSVFVVISGSVFDSTGSYAPTFLFASVATVVLALSVLAGYNIAIRKRVTANN